MIAPSLYHTQTGSIVRKWSVTLLAITQCLAQMRHLINVY